MINGGPDTAQVAQIEARIKSIQARLAAAAAEEQGLTLTASMDGVVVRLPFKAGEMVSPGTKTVLLADLSRFEVELVNLTEIQVGRVRPGQEAVVRFDAFPGLEMRGAVVWVDPQGENRQGDIVYRTRIALQEQTPDLRWNITVTAEIEPSFTLPTRLMPTLYTGWAFYLENSPDSATIYLVDVNSIGGCYV